MCLILAAYRSHPDYELMILANRDEFYDRPTRQAHWWEDHPDLLAGKDLKAGGTWLGITRAGRFAALTNYRSPDHARPEAPSRGKLVSDFLVSTETVCAFGQTHLSDVRAYNGFNIFFYDRGAFYYFSSLKEEIEELSPGIYGLSNGQLDDPWPKIRKGKDAFAELLMQPEPGEDQAFQLLQDAEPAPDDQLPDTGVGLDKERLLSPLHIRYPGYGTRSSNVLFLKKDGSVAFHERDHLTGESVSFEW